MNRVKSLLLGLGLGLAAGLASAQEQIRSFHSDIVIASDGSMVVTETLRINVEGLQIRRGIFRDFPTRYRDRIGNRYVVDFELLSATRDGASERSRVETIGDGVRIYLGSASELLDPGEYEYQIRYRTDRQLGFFRDYDELYWNVTGNDWIFPINEASATVTLPVAVPAGDITMEGYTGPFGATGQAYSSGVADGSASIVTTERLPAQAGLTLAMTWPKSIVVEPTQLQRLQYTLEDNRALLMALFAFLGSLLYLTLAWQRVGRDPDSGVIFPEYKPPAGYSPAAARYISLMRYDTQTFSTALVNLAVKGHLIIEKAEGVYTLQRQHSKATMAAGERALVDHLFGKSDAVKLDVGSRSAVMKAMKAHRRSLQRDYLNVYFARNSLFLFPSLLASIGLLAYTVVDGSMVMAAGVVFAAILPLHGLFAYLLQAPSVKGRLFMDKVERFKLYLSVAEQDELRSKYPPEKTPELFEEFLPFAIALGVEEAWAGQFTAVFRRLQAQTGQAYQPGWYHGRFYPAHAGDVSFNFSVEMSSAINTSVTPPGSSSGSGGGGFSGGGGGGGGGGGW